MRIFFVRSCIKSISEHVINYWPATSNCLYCTTSSHGVSNSKKLNVLFYGSDKFSLETLKLLNNNFSLQDADEEKFIKDIHVISGENSLITKYAKGNSLTTFPWPVSNLAQNLYDVGVVVSFGHLIPQDHINSCKDGIINVHGSLLPKWRGPSPIHHSILAGDKITGVTIMKIVADKFDVGSMLAKEEYEIPNRATTPSVYADLSVIGAKLLMDTLKHLKLRLSTAVPQPSVGATKAPKPKKIHGQIDFTTMPASEVDCRVRALTRLVDTFWEWPFNKQLKLYLLEVLDPEETKSLAIDSLISKTIYLKQPATPGSIYYHKRRKELCFKCADGNWISVSKLRMIGKRVMNGQDFYNGFLANINRTCFIPSPCS